MGNKKYKYVARTTWKVMTAGMTLIAVLVAGEAFAQDQMVSKEDVLRQLSGQEARPKSPPGGELRLRGPAGVRTVVQKVEEPVVGKTPPAPTVSSTVSVPEESVQPVQAVQSASAPLKPEPQQAVETPEPMQEKSAPVKEITVTINFKSGATQLADAFSRKQLQLIAEAFASPALKNAHIEIGGHTDGVGSPEYNRALSLHRAKAVRDEICRKNKASCARFAVVGYGMSRPVASNDDEEGRAKNRRVVFKRLD